MLRARIKNTDAESVLYTSVWSIATGPFDMRLPDPGGASCPRRFHTEPPPQLPRPADGDVLRGGVRAGVDGSRRAGDRRQGPRATLAAAHAVRAQARADALTGGRPVRSIHVCTPALTPSARSRRRRARARARDPRRRPPARPLHRPGLRDPGIGGHPGRVYDSLDARFADLRAGYEIVQVLPDPETIEELPDGRLAITGEAHLTRADGAGVSTPIRWIATVQDGRVVAIEGMLGGDGASSG